MLKNKFCSINFKQYEKPEKTLPANSEVMKALQEQENSQRGIAGLAELQEDRGSSSKNNTRLIHTKLKVFV